MKRSLCAELQRRNAPDALRRVDEPLFDSLHADPRRLPLFQKLGFAPEQFAKIEFQAL